MCSEARDRPHPELDREIEAISGRMVFTKEARLPVNGREVLYLAGHAVYDTSCCGTGGCGYAVVPGFVLKWKYRTDEAGLAVSRVEPIRDEDVQEEVRRAILEREMVSQVSFE